jgi:tetratricopeptide (TPR) repeat protein
VAVLGKGVALQLLPIGLSPDYSFNAIPLVRGPHDPRFLGTLAMLALVGWALSSRKPEASSLRLAVLWYAVAILPTSNLLLTTGTIFGERLLYLPSVAFCLLAGTGAAWLIRRWKPVGVSLTAAVLVALALQALRYSSAWTDDLSLFTWAVAATPESTKAHHKLGEELLRAGEYGPALRSLNRSLEIAPDNEFAAQTLQVARLQLARQFLSPPGEEGSGSRPPADPDVLYLLGQMSREQGDMAQARLYWEEALAADPAHGPALGDMGVLSLAEGDTLAALGLLTDAVRNDPALASAWYGLARIHLARGETTDAVQDLREFLRSAGARFPQEVRWAEDILAQLGAG